jgi:two-component system nitrogen regulation sensor histidine kinase NtrY
MLPRFSKSASVHIIFFHFFIDRFNYDQEVSKQKNQKVRNSIESLDPIEQKKRRRERFAIGIILLLIVSLFVIEFRLGKFSSTLPFVNSIFFFGLLNLNLILILGLFWLIFRNISKLFIERRRKILGAKLKTKLVISFLAFSIVPTLVLFAISALYITSSFDKWFSLKIQNTLEASIEITRNYYEGAQDTGLHFANHISERFSQSQAYRWSPQAFNMLSILCLRLITLQF